MKIFLVEHNPRNMESASRWAAEKKTDYYPDVISVEKGLGIKIRRKIYGNYLDSVIKPKEGCIISASDVLIKSGAFDVFEIVKPDFSEIKTENDYVEEGILKNVEIQTEEMLPETPVSFSNVVFIGGRGLRNKENYELMKKTAENWGASWGCTRPLAASGWDSFSRVVGVSGTMLNAKLCITFGVSGSGPFVSGIQNVEKVIAVNNDSSALIFEYADVGIVGDALTIIKSLGNGD